MHMDSPTTNHKQTESHIPPEVILLSVSSTASCPSPDKAPSKRFENNEIRLNYSRFQIPLTPVLSVWELQAISGLKQFLELASNEI